jgi:glycosyltransferase involved in cell wall biosynthesis
MQELPGAGSRGLELPETAASGPAEPSSHRAEVRGASVVVVDASCFTLPYDYSLCNALVRGGCEVLLVQSEFLYANWDLPRSFKVSKHFYPRTHKWAAGRRQGRLWKLAKGAEHLFSMRSLAKDVARSKPDIVHFQWLPAPLLDQFYLAELARHSRLVLTLHNSAAFHGSVFARFTQKVGLERALRHFSEIIVHTEFSRRTVLERGWAAPERVHVVPHGVLDYYESLAGDEVSPDQDLRILFFGNIEVYKGLDVLLKAFALLPETLDRKTRLVVAGRPGCDMTALQQLAGSLGIQDRVEWKLGFIPEQEVAGLFRSAAVVALPYLEIDQSGVLLTAIGFERPIVATRVGGIPETIQDGVHGALVEPGDVAGLAAALGRMLSDPAARHSAEKALHALRTGPLSWDRSASETIKIYRDLLTAGGSRPN